MTLNLYGTLNSTKKQCSSWNIPPGQQIDEISVYYDSSNNANPIQFISFVAGIDFLMIGN